jgi:hypothetical protein
VRTRRDGRVPHRMRGCGPAATRSTGRRDRVDLCDAASLLAGDVRLRCAAPDRPHGELSSRRSRADAACGSRRDPTPRDPGTTGGGSAGPRGSRRRWCRRRVAGRCRRARSRLRRAVAGEREATTERSPRRSRSGP